MAERYTARPTPQSYSPGWLLAELQRIQRAIPASAPASSATLAMLSADVTLDSSSAVDTVLTGLDLAIASGESWTVRYLLWLATGAGDTGGFTLTLGFPSVARLSASVLSPTSASASAGLAWQNKFVAPGTSLLVASPPIIQFAATGDVAAILDVTILAAAAAGTLTLSAATGTDTETKIVRKSSAMIAQRV